MRIYNRKITTLKSNEVFVFGSNTEGRHGKGAALQAVKFGAEYGISKGWIKQTYAIVTKNLRNKFQPSISSGEIAAQIVLLYRTAIDNPNIDFLIAYKGTGKNLNDYTPNEMAAIFACASNGVIPLNIIFEKQFCRLVKLHIF